MMRGIQQGIVAGLGLVCGTLGCAGSRATTMRLEDGPVVTAASPGSTVEWSTPWRRHGAAGPGPTPAPSESPSRSQPSTGTPDPVSPGWPPSTGTSPSLPAQPPTRSASPLPGPTPAPTTAPGTTRAASPTRPATTPSSTHQAAPRRRVVDPHYLLQPGDHLEILYGEAWSAGREYQLLAGDELRVEFLHLTEEVGEGARGGSLDRTLRIQPDGRITLPHLGAVEVAGLTPGEASDKLNLRYREYYVEPRMHVTLLSTGAALRDLRASLKTAGSRLVDVDPEGHIVLPHVGRVQAAGLTLAELQSELQERYATAVKGLGVTVRLVYGDPLAASTSSGDADEARAGQTKGEPAAIERN